MRGTPSTRGPLVRDGSLTSGRDRVTGRVWPLIHRRSNDDGQRDCQSHHPDHENCRQRAADQQERLAPKVFCLVGAPCPGPVAGPGGEFGQVVILVSHRAVAEWSHIAGGGTLGGADRCPGAVETDHCGGRSGGQADGRGFESRCGGRGQCRTSGQRQFTLVGSVYRQSRPGLQLWSQRRDVDPGSHHEDRLRRLGRGPESGDHLPKLGGSGFARQSGLHAASVHPHHSAVVGPDHGQGGDIGLEEEQADTLAADRLSDGLGERTGGM